MHSRDTDVVDHAADNVGGHACRHRVGVLDLVRLVSAVQRDELGRDEHVAERRLAVVGGRLVVLADDA